jgi:hypothetical protein
MAAPADASFDPARGVWADDPMGNVLNSSSTIRVVLPDGLTDMEAAAKRFIQHLTPEMHRKLDDAIQTLVFAPLGGLQMVCSKNSDLSRLLARPLVDQTAAFLADHLPAADVAEVELSAAAAKGKPLEYHIQKFYHRAAPLVQAPHGRDQTTYLLHPASPASLQITAAASHVLSEVELVPGTGPTDLTLLREQGFLMPSELASLLSLCQSAYGELAHAPAVSPHARFDVQEWLPLQT